MRVARLLLPAPSHFDLKCFRLDREIASGTADAAWSLANAAGLELRPLPQRALTRELRQFAPDILHVYGSAPMPHAMISAAGSPWLADRPLKATRPMLGRRPRAQSLALLHEIPEPVGDNYFSEQIAERLPARMRIGSVRQSSRSESSRDLVNARIRRFRDDIDWILYDTPPLPAEMASLSLWVDLSSDEGELDGMLCEALVLGLPVVATRTAANMRRTEDGRAAALCPKGDPNEIAHAIVTMLFKPERSGPIVSSARALRERFRTGHRRDALLAAYEEIIG